MKSARPRRGSRRRGRDLHVCRGSHCVRRRPCRRQAQGFSEREEAMMRGIVAGVVVVLGSVAWAEEGVGVFSDKGDVGGPARSGNVQYDAGEKTYRVSGGGANMWADKDAFYFVWKK